MGRGGFKRVGAEGEGIPVEVGGGTLQLCSEQAPPKKSGRRAALPRHGETPGARSSARRGTSRACARGPTAGGQAELYLYVVYLCVSV